MSTHSMFSLRNKKDVKWISSIYLSIEVIKLSFNKPNIALKALYSTNKRLYFFYFSMKTYVVYTH